MLAFLLVRTLICIARTIPRKLGLRIFSIAGSAVSRFYRRDRARAVRNIMRAFPGTDPLIATAVARGSFAALGRNALDALRLVALQREKVLELCSVDGEENLRGAFEDGRGVIALSGHIGCWELLAAWFSLKGYKVNVIARSLHDKRMNRMLVNMRERHGITSIPRMSGAVAAYRALRRGEILAMLLDQDIDVDGVFVPFFGIPAHTPRGAAAFAHRSGAAIVPVAIHMQPDHSHRITVMPKLEMPAGDLPAAQWIDEVTLRCSRALESLIRIYPQQWVWFHDRWRKKPDDGSRVYGLPAAGDGSARIG
jgi:KDO2-lipid IV(A) lauroyltransferase